MFKTGKIFFLTISFSLSSLAHSQLATCPPALQVKAATLTRAISYDGENLWELISVPFNYDGKLWDVSYGLELPHMKDPHEALQQGQLGFSQAKIIKNAPVPDQYPGHFLCDYTNSDVQYWIQASSPPG